VCRYAEANGLGFEASGNPPPKPKGDGEPLVPAPWSNCAYGALSGDGDECWVEGEPPE